VDQVLALQIIVGVIIGFGAGYLGSFMVLKRMSLVGDALSHVALPGIAIAFIFNINPFIGAFFALFLAILGIWVLEKKTELPSETLVGIFFTLSLAIGLLITPEAELFEALFGDISRVNFNDLIITIILSLIIVIVMAKIKNGLTLGTISKDLTKSMGFPVAYINLLFLSMVAIIVAMGLKVVGTLLMGSLVIIPAAAAKNISHNLNRYVFFAGLLGALSALFGVQIAHSFNFSAGPIIVLVSGVIFMVSLIFKR
jgi:ABC-type Mn2+/Zn2+ transport system permease subunit